VYFENEDMQSNNMDEDLAIALGSRTARATALTSTPTTALRSASRSSRIACGCGARWARRTSAS